MKNLSINASVVPVVYRVEASSNGEFIGRSTAQCLPSEIKGKADDVKHALEQHGYDSVTVTYWEA